VTTHCIRGPNWLLRGLLVISLGIHALLLLHIVGLYNSQDVDYIELEMRTQERPHGRDIPVPPKFHRKIPARKQVVPVKNPDLPPVPKDLVRPSVVEPIAMPEVPDVSKPKLITWSPPKANPGTRPVSSSSATAYSSAGDYFSLVRMMIERNKQYPYLARKHRIQGQVKVHFMIGINGRIKDVSIEESSGHEVLDDAALRAVKASSPFPKPPAELFTGPIPVEICIVFQLM